jgi:hypothetical protein
VIEAGTECINRFPKSHVYVSIDVLVYVLIDTDVYEFIYITKVVEQRGLAHQPAQEPPTNVHKGMAKGTLETARKPCPLGSDLPLGTGPRPDDTSADSPNREK